MDKIISVMKDNGNDFFDLIIKINVHSIAI
jgi:hypothetical protein